MAEKAADEPLFVGRDAACNRIRARLIQAQQGRSQLVLVAGEAGLGKTTLVRRVLETQAPSPTVVWGTCWAGVGAPGYWPWTQALDALVAQCGPAACSADIAELLGSVVPALGRPRPPSANADPRQARLLLFDAVARWLTVVTHEHPLVLVLDDLQWADRSSLELLDFLGRSLHTAALVVIGTYRHDEVPAELRDLFVGLTMRADHIQLSGLAGEEVERLVTDLAGARIGQRWSQEIHRRTGGHPFFVRELAAELEHRPSDQDLGVPSVVRDVIEQRLRRGDADCRQLLDAASVLGSDVQLDVLSAVLDLPVPLLAEREEQASAVGVLVQGPGGRTRFAHDLFRETLYAGLPARQRLDLHHRIAEALEQRDQQGRVVRATEVARHFAAAVALDGADRAVRWAFTAAAADRANLAFSEAAGHLQRVRDAITNAGLVPPLEMQVELLVAQADAHARAGEPDRARELLTSARPIARRCSGGDQLAAVAFGVQHLGARFAMPRQPIIDILDEARAAATDQDRAVRARLTAALARELTHSVPAHRPRAGPLSTQALDLARACGDPASLLACLLARHDVLWTPGTAAERLGLAHDIVELAQTLGDVEQRAEGLLLVANALLESGSAQFRPALDSCLEDLGSLGQPRHDYTALTRLAALQLLDGDLDGAELRIEEAARLGELIGEPDAGNVRMSQRLALVQLRADPDTQRAFADEAVRWWIGAPVHAHAVAAGFLARAGDLEAARRHLVAVAELGGWHADRSYLWSVFISQIAEAAALLGDQQLCQQVLDDLRPFTNFCGVNGAVVAFAGSLAHPAGMVAAAAGHSAEAAELFQQAADVHHRLDAPLWESASRGALATLTSVEPEHLGVDVARLRRRENGWAILYRSQTVAVPDSKGWHDLAQLLQHPGVDIHALELMGSPLRQGPAGATADATAIGSYRARLHQLEEDRQGAETNHDLGRLARVEVESQMLLAELGRITGLGGAARPGSSGSSERARKAVSARIRDAIQRLTPILPDIAAHLDRNIVTGNWCRYRPEPTLTWHVEV